MKRTSILFVLFLSFILVVLSISGCTSNAKSQTAQVNSEIIQQNNKTSTDFPAEQGPSDSQSIENLSSVHEDPLAAKSSATSSASTAQARQRVETFPVIYYHSIKTIPNNELGMPPEEFEKQISYLAEHGYHSISSQQLYNYYYNKGSLPSRPIMITFDDGYMDNYTTAFPILKKYGFTATVFLIVKKVGDPNCLTWKEVKELDQEGWDIQSHTLTHPDLTKISSHLLEQELVDSKAILEKELGKPIQFFAYPSGKHNDAVVQGVKNAGYLMAFSTLKGWTDEKMNPFLVHRVYCYASMGLTEFSRRVTNPQF